MLKGAHPLENGSKLYAMYIYNIYIYVVVTTVTAEQYRILNGILRLNPHCTCFRPGFFLYIYFIHSFSW